MIYTGSNEILGIKLGNTDISAIYAGDLLIYPTTVTGWSVSPSSIEAEKSGGTATIRITSLSAWTISSNESWITFSQNSGESGRTSVIVSFGNNETGLERYGTITVTDGTNTTTIAVTQLVCTPIIISSITSTIYTVPAGTEHFNNCNFDTTGVYSLTRDTRCQNIQLNYSATTNSLKDVDIQLDFENAQDNYVRFSECFKDCTELTSVTISGLADYKIISCYAMFRNCTSLTSITMDSFIAGYEGSMSSYDYMFAGCSNLVTIDAIDLTRWSNVSNMFSGCTKLENLTITNIKDASLTNWGLSQCTALTVASIVSIFNALPVASASRTITIGTTNKNKLSAEQLAIATNKGWTVD